MYYGRLIARNRITTVLILLSCCLGLEGCALYAKAHPEIPKIHAGLRYTVTTDNKYRFERLASYSVFEDHAVEFIERFGDIPLADGPMQVSCDDVLEIGIIIRPESRPHKWYFNHDYDAGLTRSDGAENVPRYLTYDKHWWYHFIRVALRFRGNDDLPGGKYDLAVVHRDNVLYSTGIEISACEDVGL